MEKKKTNKAHCTSLFNPPWIKQLGMHAHHLTHLYFMVSASTNQPFSPSLGLPVALHKWKLCRSSHLIDKFVCYYHSHLPTSLLLL